MKKLAFPIIILLVATLSSCLNGKYETTPVILIDPLIFVNADDTIGIVYNTTEAKYSTDTMLLGDTMFITVGFDAVGNNITSGQIKYQSEYAELTVMGAPDLGDDFIPAITDGAYDFTMATGYRGIFLMFRYIPKKTGTALLEFSIRSDSEFSPASFSLLTPIADPAAE